MTLIERTHLSEYLRRSQKAGSLHLVVGETGIGKSHFCREYLSQYPDTAFVEVSSDTIYGFDTESVAAKLCAQYAAVSGQTYVESIDDSPIRSLPRWHRSAVNAVPRHDLLVVIVDGLSEVAEASRTAARELIELLPIGERGTSVILTSWPADLPLPSRHQSLASPFTLPPLSSSETQQYIESVGIAGADAEAIKRICRGNPGRLTSLCRIARSNGDTKEALTSTELSELLDLEISAADQLSERAQLALAIIAFDYTFSERDALRRIAQLESHEQAALESLTFLEIADERITFLTPALRSSAAGRLNHLKAKALSEITKYYVDHPHADVALSRLARLLSTQGSKEAVLEHLSADRIDSALSEAASTSNLLTATTVGLEAAYDLGQEDEACRLTLTAGALKEATSDTILLRRVAALAWLSRIDEALELARSVPLREVRVEAYAAMIEAIAESRDRVEQSIVDELDADIDQLEEGVFGVRVSDIASQLLRGAPKAAMKLIRRTAGASGDAERLDLSLVRLAVLSARGPSSDETLLREAASQLHDPTLRTLLSNSAIALRGVSALTVIDRAKALERVDERLFLLQSWMRANARVAGATDVLTFALEQARTAGDYNITAQALQTLSSALLHEKSEQSIAAHLIDVDRLKVAAVANSPRIDLVALECRLARIQVAAGQADAGFVRLGEVAEIARGLDAVTQLRALSLLLDTLAASDALGFFDKEGHLESFCKLQFSELCSRLIETTADHYEVFGEPCRILAKRLLDISLSVAQSLNLQVRRDAALRDIVRSHIELKSDSWDCSKLQEAIERIFDVSVRDASIRSVLEAASRSRTTVLPEGSAKHLLSLVQAIVSPSYRARAAAQLAFLRCEKNESVRAQAISICNQAIDGMSMYAERCDALYTIVPIFSQFSMDEANRVFEHAERLRSQSAVALVSDTSGVLSIELAIRCVQAYSEPIPSRVMDDVLRQISTVTEAWRQSRLFSLLAGSLWRAGHQEEARRVTVDRLIPLLSAQSTEDLPTYFEILVHGSPSLWRDARSTFTILAEQLPDSLHTRVLSHVARQISWPVFDGDPIDPSTRSSPTLGYEQLTDLVVLAQHCRDDGSAADFSRTVFSAAQRASAQSRMSRTQLTHLGSELLKVAEKLPMKHRGIEHEGWKIVVESFARILRGEGADQVYRAMSIRAQKLPNSADVPFVLTYLAINVAPARDRETLIESICSLSEALPFAGDAIDRILYLAESLAESRAPSTRRVYKRLANFVSSTPSDQVRRGEARLIRSAFAFERELGTQVASLLDSDLGRRASREEESFTARKDSYNARSGSFAEGISPPDLEEVCEALLGSLHAKRLPFARTQARSELILRASRTSIEESYWTMSFAIESAIAECRQTRGSAERTATALFDACIRGSRVADAVRRRAVQVNSGVPEVQLNGQLVATNVVVASIADIERAEQRLLDWIKSVELESIVVVDPYFSPEDIEFIARARQLCPDSAIKVLSSLPRGFSMDDPGVLEQAVRSQWRRFSAEKAGDIVLVVYQTELSKKCPFHDRWWLAGSSGIRVGTSRSGLGKRISEISDIVPADLAGIWELVAPFSSLTVREWNGERVLRRFISLD